MSEQLIKVTGAIEQLVDFSLLEPDAEADACSPNFLAYAKDQLNQWHAAMEFIAPDETSTLSTEVVVVRSIREMSEVWYSQQLRGRMLHTMNALLASSRALQPTPLVTEAIAILRERFEPKFRQSKRWENIIEHGSPSDPVPWIAHACFEVRWQCMLGESAPSPWAPWLALWSRGVWPAPMVDGSLLLWIPPLDGGDEALQAQLKATKNSLFSSDVRTALGFSIPRSYDGPGTGGLSYFGAQQTANLDQTPALWVRPVPPPTNPFAPTPNLPTPQPYLTAPVYGAPPPRDDLPGDSPEDSLVNRIRRWFRS